MMRIAKWVRYTFDARDLFFFVGLGLLTAGLWQVSVTHALIGSGAILLFQAVRP